MSGSIKKYLSLVKFSHTIFAMPFAFIGFALGLTDILKNRLPLTSQNLLLPTIINWDFTNWSILFLFVLVLLCMVFARSAAMAFNRYLDSSYDAKNPRTAIREIPAGVVSKKNALLFTITNCILFVTCTFFINEICFLLSPVALFVILFYSYTKRFTALCHLVLGVGLSLAPIGSYLAVTGVFTPLPIFFSLAVVCWVSGFDIIYALQDEAFDKENQLFSIPSVLGKRRALLVSVLLHCLSAAAIATAGFYGNFGVWYWIGVLVFVGMLIYQHSIVKPNDLRRVNVAFMTANGIASIVFAVFVLLDIYISYL